METITVYRRPSDGCFGYRVERDGRVIEAMKSNYQDYADFYFHALVDMGRKLPPLIWMAKVDDATWQVV